MPFAWKAIYKDGSELNQYENGAERTYGIIDKEQLEFFDLLDANGKIVLRLHLFEGRRLIYRRRVLLRQQTGHQDIVYLIGWQKTVHGENIQSINYVHENGTIFTSGAWNDLPEPYGPIIPTPEDK